VCAAERNDWERWVADNATTADGHDVAASGSTRRRVQECDRRCTSGCAGVRVLEVALGVDFLTGRGEDQVTVEVVDTGRDAGRGGDVVAERAERARRCDGLRRRRVAGG